jgi:hypothetical protein
VFALASRLLLIALALVAPQGERFSLLGIEPDNRVEPLATDFIGTTDAQLTAAIDYLRATTSKPR